MTCEFWGGFSLVTTCTSPKAQPLWAINHDGQNVYKAQTPRSSEPVKRWWGVMWGASYSTCHVPQEKEISVVDFKANDMPGTFLPTVGCDCTQVGLKWTVVLVRECQGPPGSFVRIQQSQNSKNKRIKMTQVSFWNQVITLNWRAFSLTDLMASFKDSDSSGCLLDVLQGWFLWNWVQRWSQQRNQLWVFQYCRMSVIIFKVTHLLI